MNKWRQLKGHKKKLIVKGNHWSGRMVSTLKKIMTTSVLIKGRLERKDYKKGCLLREGDLFKGSLKGIFKEAPNGPWYQSSLLKVVVGGIIRNIFQRYYWSFFKSLEGIKKVVDIIKEEYNLGYQVSYSLCKESNKLVGASNFLAWKKMIEPL